MDEIPLRASLPLFGVGIVATLLSCLFCCYLWRLKRQGRREEEIKDGYKKVEYKGKKVPNETCPVCLDDFEIGQRIALCPCSHGFHCKCLSQWLEDNNSCPMCKAIVKERPSESTSLMQRESAQAEV